jgi:glycosyltransferase involved in cell wall biosynthesis
MISVCMATYNGEKYIAEQIKSILSQLGEEDELVVSDDGSIDDTIKILESFNDSRVKIFHHNRNLDNKHPFYPSTKNFENALAKTKGDYIFLSDQDDVWMPNKVQTTLPFLKEDSLVVSDAWIINENLEKQEKLSKYMPYKKGYFRNFLKCTTQGCRIAFTKNIKNFCLPFPNGVVIHDFWIRQLAELKFKVSYIPEPLIFYRRHSNNLSKIIKSKNSPFFMVKYRAMILFESLRRYFK